MNVQRQAYNQAIATLSADIHEAVDIKVRLAEEHVQNECNRQLYELSRQLQEFTNITSAEKARMRADLRSQTLNSEQRMNELIKNHQDELERVRAELTAANAQTLANLRRELEEQVAVAQGEVIKVQSEHESALRNVQRELDRARKEGETRFGSQQKVQPLEFENHQRI